MRPAIPLIFFYGKIKGQLLRVFLTISIFNLSPGQARAFRKCLRLISFVRTRTVGRKRFELEFCLARTISILFQSQIETLNAALFQSPFRLGLFHSPFKRA